MKSRKMKLIALGLTASILMGAAAPAFADDFELSDGFGQEEVFVQEENFDVFDADGNTIESYIVPTINSYSVYCIWDPGYEIPEGGYYIQLFDSDASDANVIGSGYCEVK